MRKLTKQLIEGERVHRRSVWDAIETNTPSFDVVTHDAADIGDIPTANTFIVGNRFYVLEWSIESEDDLNKDLWTLRIFSIPLSAVRTEVVRRRKEKRGEK